MENSRELQLFTEPKHARFFSKIEQRFKSRGSNYLWARRPTRTPIVTPIATPIVTPIAGLLRLARQERPCIGQPLQQGGELPDRGEVPNQVSGIFFRIFGVYEECP